MLGYLNKTALIIDYLFKNIYWFFSAEISFQLF